MNLEGKLKTKRAVQTDSVQTGVRSRERVRRLLMTGLAGPAPLLLSSVVLAAEAAPGVTGGATATTALPEVQVRARSDADAQQDTSYQAVRSRTGMKIDAPLRDLPQTVDVVTGQLMRDQGARSMEDALRNVPGVGLGHGDGQRDQVTIRGFTALGDQFIDGMRDDGLYFRDLSNVDRVEVIKGPAAVLYGRGSSGGLINRVTKKPGADIGELGVVLGSWNTRRAELDVGRGWRDAPLSSRYALRLTGAIEKSDSYRDQQFIDRKALAPSLGLRLGRDTTLFIQADYLDDSRVTDFGVPALNGQVLTDQARTYYGAANARDVDVSHSRVRSVGFTLDHRFSDNWTLRNSLRYYHFSLDRANTLIGTVNAAALTATLNRSAVQRNEHGLFNQTELVQKAVIGGMTHRILYGLEYGHQNKDQSNQAVTNVGTISVVNPRNPVMPAAITGGTSTHYLSEMDVRSAYVQDFATLSRHWKLLAGVRFDSFEQRTAVRLGSGGDLARTDNAFSPRIGLVYQPTDALSYYASWSRSFQPSGELLALATTNADISPERTSNKEVGVKLDLFDGAATAGASLFRLERSNIKSTDPATNRVLPVGKARVNGLELSMAGDIARNWQVWGGYAWLDSKVIESIAVESGQPVLGKQTTLTPRNSANLWLTRRFGDDWRAGAGASYVSGRYANAGNTVRMPSYVVFDAMAGGRVGPVELQLNLRNLFNRRYIISGHGNSATQSLPGSPRAFMLSARYRF